MNFAFDTNTNTKLNIILAILAIILVLAMILVFRGTGEGYASCGKSESYALPLQEGTITLPDGTIALLPGYHKMPDGTIMKDSDHMKGEGYASCGEGYAVTCPSSNDACNDNMCAICKANQNNPDYYSKGGCAVCA